MQGIVRHWDKARQNGLNQQVRHEPSALRPCQDTRCLGFKIIITIGPCREFVGMPPGFNCSCQHGGFIESNAQDDMALPFHRRPRPFGCTGDLLRLRVNRAHGNFRFPDRCHFFALRNLVRRQTLATLRNSRPVSQPTSRTTLGLGRGTSAATVSTMKLWT